MTRYLAPYATVELALILINGGQIEEAGLLLETAKYVHCPLWWQSWWQTWPLWWWQWSYEWGQNLPWKWKAEKLQMDMICISFWHEIALLWDCIFRISYKDYYCEITWDYYYEITFQDKLQRLQLAEPASFSNPRSSEPASGGDIEIWILIGKK